MAVLADTLDGRAPQSQKLKTAPIRYRAGPRRSRTGSDCDDSQLLCTPIADIVKINIV